MEAPYRFMIASFSDVERFLSVLAASPHVIPNSLRLTEGAELLVQQLSIEHRQREHDLVAQAKLGTGIQTLFRSLWSHPLSVQRPRFLRLEAKILVPPPQILSLRMDVPTIDALPRWVDAEGSHNAQELARLQDIYRRLSQASRLTFIAV